MRYALRPNDDRLYHGEKPTAVYLTFYEQRAIAPLLKTNKPIPRAELFHSVYNIEYDGKSRKLDKLVSRLRDKIKAHFTLIGYYKTGYELAVKEDT